MYMQGFRCKVTDVVSGRQLAEARPPVLCRDDETQCVQGAKQMIAWNRESNSREESSIR
jgi:hypothetical protein